MMTLQPRESPTLLGILRTARRTPDRCATDFLRLAAAAQTARLLSGGSNNELVTSSTALWSILQLAPDIAMSLRPSGLDADQLGQALGILSRPKPLDVPDIGLHDDFARALLAYVQRQREDRPVGLADVIVAV